MNDLLNIELVNDHLKQFLPSTNGEVDFNAECPSALNRSDQTHRKEPKSYMNLKAMVTHALGRPAVKILLQVKKHKAR